MAGPSDTDVIAAVGTAPGRAGIGVVRVSGKRLEQLASHLLGGVPAPRRAVRAVFRGAAGEPIDGFVPPAVADLIRARGLYVGSRGYNVTS